MELYYYTICTIYKHCQLDGLFKWLSLLTGCSDDPAHEAGVQEKSNMNISSNEAYGAGVVHHIAHRDEEAEETIYNYPIEAQQNEAYATTIVTQGNEAYATVTSITL